MRCVTVCAFLCFVGSAYAHDTESPGWDLHKTYTYRVEGDGLSVIGSSQNVDLQWSYNIQVTKITQDTIHLKPGVLRQLKSLGPQMPISAELQRYFSSPIEMTYRQGRVATIKLESDVPVNNKKSQLSPFIFNSRIVGTISGTTELREMTVFGKCDVHYEVDEIDADNDQSGQQSSDSSGSSESGQWESTGNAEQGYCKGNEKSFQIVRSFSTANCDSGSSTFQNISNVFVVTRYFACGPSKENYDIVRIEREERIGGSHTGRTVNSKTLVLTDVSAASVNQLKRITSPKEINLGFNQQQRQQQQQGNMLEAIGQDGADDTFVTIKNGTLRGKISMSDSGRPIYNYQKIPYAKPPVGQLRFEPPQIRTEGWGNTVWDATKSPPSCPQFLTALLRDKEDCLYLNVHTPRAQNQTSNPLPVMVFMHGGAFAFGDSRPYGPDKLLANDVVLVVPHYRLGALGFLSTGDSVVPGNNGLKDIVQSLRWVKENIAAFGGDPNKVTIFGESAGAAGSLMVLLSPLAKGLFHRVISQSGTPLSQWAMDRTPWESAQRYAAGLKCPIDTSANLIACLRNKSTLALKKRSFDKLVGELLSLNIVFEATAPVIEPDLPGAFLSKDPFEMFEDGSIPDVPIMLGTVQHEGLRFLETVNKLVWKDLADDPIFIRDKMVPNLLTGLGIDEEVSGGAPISQSLILAYLPDSPRMTFMDIAEGVTDMLSTTLFKAPVLRTLETLLKRPGGRNNNIFLYSFEHQGSDNFLQRLMYDVISKTLKKRVVPLKLQGVGHADDLQYFFTLPGNITGVDREFSNMVCKIWTDFARTGNPTPNTGVGWPKWPAYSFDNKQYYKLVRHPEVKEDYTKNWVQGFAYP